MKHAVIGSIEQIEIQEYGSFSVSAKIDTGADSSAIWASEISQEDGALSFCFFGPGYVGYTGETYTTATFRVATIKNSFGHKEVRYKVQLTVKIGDRKIKSWFTLADRSKNNYPVLIGRRFLKNKYIVDVAQSHVHGDEKGARKVLVISRTPSVTESFLKEVESNTEENITFEGTRFEDLLFDINGSQTDVLDTARDNRSLTAYDLTYVKAHWNYPEPASALAEFLTFKNKPFLDKEIRDYTSRSKLSEMMRLSVNMLPVPRAIVGYAPALASNSQFILDAISLPAVVKNVMSDKGLDNYLIQTVDDYKEVLQNAPENAIFAVQRFVPNEGFYRFNVFGGEVVLVVYRHKVEHENPRKAHLNKPVGGKNAHKVELSEVSGEVLELASRAAMCLNRQVAGVDMLQDSQTGEWYILEVNNSPQLRTGANTKEKAMEFAKFIERRLEK